MFYSEKTPEGDRGGTNLHLYLMKQDKRCDKVAAEAIKK